MQTTTIELRNEYKFSTGTTNTLTMREPNVSDQEASSKQKDNSAAAEIRLFANLCMVTPDDIRLLGLHDYRRLQKAFTDFIE